MLEKVSKELYVIRENKTIHTGTVSNRYPKSKMIRKYFDHVNNAQKNIFKENFFNSYSSKVKIFSILYGDLNKITFKSLRPALKSDLYIVYGSSYIKGKLADFLIKNKAINIHAGISPYYRGTDCNFWAYMDNNLHLIGSTIHLLGKGLDNGPILYHSRSEITGNYFEYSMKSILAAFISICEKIENKSIKDIKAITQDKSLEIRYSKITDFTETVIKEFFKPKDIKVKRKKIKFKDLYQI